MPYLKRNAVNRLNLAYRNQQRPDERKEYAQQAKAYAQIVIRRESQDYNMFDLLGQSKLLSGDSLAALLDFQNAGKLYQENPPEEADYTIAYTYYRSALIQNFSMANPDLALSSTQEGLRLIQREYARSQPYRKVQMELFKDARESLVNFELDLLLKNPSEKSIQKFAKAVEQDPDNYNKRCAYASLLEASKPELAIEQYRLAYQIAPKQKLAPYNIAVIYINQAASILKSTPDDTNMEEMEKINQRVKSINQKALPFLEIVHEIDPKDAEIIKTLLNLSIQLDDSDRFEKYKKIQANLRK